ncbi:MAG: AraC family transcriptional regulator [Verrucomicrobia bacterium]|nr:AraC family transcriptional regulator [Verrucomicrobiota bacterium]MBU4292221.1 AraC family transcriptional regulator [Verrucomicrobiota bacterium]MBU4428608.1 AraC family transcriptional regulator [Verrucomicrobiota bacterium]MCG2678387.1 AraC family transcriptional regulator [Kiritimatiellia bacterium]
MGSNYLTLNPALPMSACNAGVLVSRGKGIHPERVIDSYELILVRQGCLGIREEGRPFLVKPGQTLLLWPGRRHGGTMPYAPDLSFYWIHFRLRSVRCRKAIHGLRVPQSSTLTDPERLAVLFRLFLDDQESGELRPLTANLLVLLMLSEVAGGKRSGLVEDTPAMALANHAEAFVRTHFHEPITTATVAAALRCNPDYLGRICRKAWSHPLTTHLHERRVCQARVLLRDSRMNIKEIADACGFGDVGYFRRIFKRYEGILPLAYRRLFVRMHVNTE